MPKKLLVARIDTSTKSVVKRQYIVGRSIAEIDYVTKVVTAQFHDEWREWEVSRSAEGLIRLKNGPVIYSFTVQQIETNEARAKRPYYTEPADRFIAYCGKLLKRFGIATKDVGAAIENAVEITEIGQSFDDTAVPFGLRVTRLEDGNISVMLTIQNVELSELELTDAAVGLRRILSLIRKLQRNYSRVYPGRNLPVDDEKDSNEEEEDDK